MRHTAEITLKGVFSLVPLAHQGSRNPTQYLVIFPLGTDTSRELHSVDLEVLEQRDCGQALLPHRSLAVFRQRDLVTSSGSDLANHELDIHGIWNLANQHVSFDTNLSGDSVVFDDLAQTIRIQDSMERLGIGEYKDLSRKALDGTSKEVASQVLFESGSIGLGSVSPFPLAMVQARPDPNNPFEKDPIGLRIASSLVVSMEFEDRLRIVAKPLDNQTSAPSTLEFRPSPETATGEKLLLTIGNFCQNPLDWDDCDRHFFEKAPATDLPHRILPDADFKWLYRLRERPEALSAHLKAIDREAPVPAFPDSGTSGGPFRCYFAVESVEEV